MNNTDKLLRAFIEASGYEVEITKDYQEVKLTKSQASHHFQAREFGSQPRRRLLTDGVGQCAYLVDDDGMYTEVALSPIIDYKVTKSKLQQGLDDNKISEPKTRHSLSALG